MWNGRVMLWDGIYVAFNIPASIIVSFLIGYEYSRLYEVKKEQNGFFLYVVSEHTAINLDVS